MKPHDDFHKHVETIQGPVGLVSFSEMPSLDISNSHSTKAQHALYLFESLRKTVDPASSALPSDLQNSSSPAFPSSNQNLRKSFDIDNRVTKIRSPKEAVDLTSELQSKLLSAEATMRILYHQNQELRDRLAHVMGKIESGRNLSVPDIPIFGKSKATPLSTSGTESSVRHFCINKEERYEKSARGGGGANSQLCGPTAMRPEKPFGCAQELRDRKASPAQLIPFSDLSYTPVALSPSPTEGSRPSMIDDHTSKLVNPDVREQLDVLRQQLIKQQIQHDVELSHMNEKLYRMERKRELQYI